MGVVAHSASVPQGLVLKNVRLCLGLVTLTAGLIHASHEHTLGLVNVLPVWVVATDTTHLFLNDRVMVL